MKPKPTSNQFQVKSRSSKNSTGVKAAATLLMRATSLIFRSIVKLANSVRHADSKKLFFKSKRTTSLKKQAC